MALGVCVQKLGACVRNLLTLAHAGECVGKVTPRGLMHQRIVHCDQRQVCVARKNHAAAKPFALARAVVEFGRNPHAARGERFETADERGLICTAFHHDELQALMPIFKIVEEQNALALLRAHVANGQQAAEAPPCGAVLRKGEHVGRAIAEDEARARRHMQTKLVLARINMGAHHARHRIAIGYAKSCKPQSMGLRHHFLGVRGTVQEGKIGGDGKLRIGDHYANRPCTNQRGACVSLT